jgi:hypothetical protein
MGIFFFLGFLTPLPHWTGLRKAYG